MKSSSAPTLMEYLFGHDNTSDGRTRTDKTQMSTAAPGAKRMKGWIWSGTRSRNAVICGYKDTISAHQLQYLCQYMQLGHYQHKYFEDRRHCVPNWCHINWYRLHLHMAILSIETTQLKRVFHRGTLDAPSGEEGFQTVPFMVSKHRVHQDHYDGSVG